MEGVAGQPNPTWSCIAVVFPHSCFSLPFSFSSCVNYFFTVFTIWRDELGIGRLFEASGIPLATAAGASMTIAARNAIAYLANRGFAFRALNFQALTSLNEAV